jgi:hypothetical protein
MIANLILVSDEFLEDTFCLRVLLAKIMWYDSYRQLRISRNWDKLMRLKSEGKPIFHTKRRKTKPDYSEEEYEGL